MRGTELRGKRTFVPGAEYGDAQPNLNRGGGTGTTTVIIPATPPAPERDVLMFRPGVGDVATNLSGNPATLVDLSTLNAGFQGIGWLLPGAAGDQNTIQFANLAAPSNMNATPKLRLRLHLIIPP